MRVLYVGAADVLRSLASNEVVRPLLEPILHPIALAHTALGLSTAAKLQANRASSGAAQSVIIELPTLSPAQ
jgi:hypothetical protein